MPGPQRSAERRIRPVPYGVVVLAGGLVAVGIGACGDAVGPDMDPVGPDFVTVGDLEVELTLSADGCDAFAFVGLHRGGERVGVSGTGRGCFDVPTTWVIPAGFQQLHEWRVTAETFEEDPISLGLYVFRVEFLVDLPDLETSVRIQ